MHILVVDDEPKIRRGLSKLIALRDPGFTVSVAENGLKALELVETCKPDAIFVDIKMPLMDGLTFMKRVRETLPSMFFVVVSGYADFEYAKEAVQIGAVDYILKPIMPQKIFEVLDKLKDLLAEREENTKKYSYYIEKKIIDVLVEHKTDSLEDIGVTGSYDLLIGNYKDLGPFTQDLSSQEKDKLQKELSLLVNQESFVFFYEQKLIAIVREGELPEEVLAQLEKNYDYMVFHISRGLDGDSSFYSNYMSIIEEDLQKDKEVLEKEDIQGVSGRIVAYIHENYEKKINLKDIAEYVYMHSTHISKLFKKETGINISEYIVNYRIYKAKELLTDPRYRIYDVADLVGFSSSKYFVSVFKQKTGMTPTDFRNMNL